MSVEAIQPEQVRNSTDIDRKEIAYGAIVGEWPNLGVDVTRKDSGEHLRSSEISAPRFRRT